MKYEVLKDYEDKAFSVLNEDGEKEPLHLVIGEEFIPATIHYPINKRDALVLNGTIKLIEPETLPPE